MSSHQPSTLRSAAIKTQEKATRKLTRVWLESSAKSLAQRLRAGGVPKAQRRATRALLREAFEALEREVAPELELIRAVDAAGRPPRPALLRAPRIGFTPRPLAIREHSILRLEAHDEFALGLIERQEAFLEFLEQRAIEGSLKSPVVVLRFGESMTLTEG